MALRRMLLAVGYAAQLGLLLHAFHYHSSSLITHLAQCLRTLTYTAGVLVHNQVQCTANVPRRPSTVRREAECMDRRYAQHYRREV